MYVRVCVSMSWCMQMTFIRVCNHLEFQCADHVEFNLHYSFWCFCHNYSCFVVFWGRAVKIDTDFPTGWRNWWKLSHAQRRTRYRYIVYISFDSSFFQRMHSTILFLVCYREPYQTNHHTNRSGFIFDVMNFSSKQLWRSRCWFKNRHFAIYFSLSLCVDESIAPRMCHIHVKMMHTISRFIKLDNRFSVYLEQQFNIFIKPRILITLNCKLLPQQI